MTTRITKWISGKTFFAALAIFGLSIGFANAQTWNIGTPNATDLKATLSEGMLTINGKGAMKDFANPDSVPWFSVRNSIKSLVIISGVTNIGDFAFYSCGGFTGNLTIPTSVTSIGNYAFSSCSGFTGNLIIPNLVTSIGNYAFFSCSGFTGNLTIPTSVTSIGNNVFSSCWGLTSITIPNSVTSIGNSAFENCDGLTSVTIPSSVTSIGNNAFSFCDSLIAINVNAGNLNYSSENGVLFNKNKTTLFLCPGGKSGNYVIPNTVNLIGDYAFYYCYGLTSVTIPNSVTSIGYGAFFGSDGLISITIPNSVTSIGYNAFGLCRGLTAINVDAGNLNYSSDNGVLFNKNKTTLIQCPGGKSGINVIPNTVTSIGDVAFWGCWGFTSITIPNSVTSIGSFAFCVCNNLTSVTIPNSVTSIGNYAFSGCYGLTSITCLNPDPSLITLGIYVFSSVIVYNCTLKVPVGSVTAYQNAAQWKDFIYIVEESATTVESITNDILRIYPNPVKDELRIEGDVPFNNLSFTIYNLAGKQIINDQWLNGKSINVSSLPQGIYFVKIKIEKGVITKKFVKE